MANSSPSRGRWIALAVLVPLCAWLVYRNLLSPGAPEVAGASPRLEAAQRGALPDANRGGETSRAARAPSEEGKALTRQQLAALDPTLRLDLLERSRQVQYEGGSRNIFQVYTPPPPKPVSDPVVGPPIAPPPPSAPPLPPPPPSVPLKFYGVATPPGSAQKKAFLTDGEEIIIGLEGDVIAKFYKIIRIGLNTIELEDNRTKQHQSLPLQEE